MGNIVGKRYKYSGLKIGHIIVLTEPRTGLLLNKKGQPRSTKACLVVCSCGNKYELSLKSVSNNYSEKCKMCKKVHGSPVSKLRVKSLFEYWMKQWDPKTHKTDTYKLPYFKGGVGEEYVAGFCYIDKTDYQKLSKVMCIKQKQYVLYNLSKDNSIRLKVKYSGCRNSNFFIHRVVANILDELKGDHISGVKIDNRSHNIRPATTLQNNHNNKKVLNKHGYKGIRCFEHLVKPWYAQLMVANKQYSKAFPPYQKP